MTLKLKRWHKALIIISVIILVWGTIAIFPRSKVKNNPLIVNDSLPLLIAHRGGRCEFPENTLEAYYNAYSINPNVMLETDVSITSDGVLVMCHDLALDRTTNITGLVSNYTYDYLLKNVDFNYSNPMISSDLGYDVYDQSKPREQYISSHPNFDGKTVKPSDVTYPSGVSARHESKFLVTTLEEVLIAFPNNLISVEIKQDGQLGALALKETINLLEKYNSFDRVSLGSFNSDIYKLLKEYKKQYKNLIFSPEYMGAAGLLITSWFLVDLFYFEPITCLQVPMDMSGIQIATRNFVATAHRHNIAVQFWTINKVEDMRRLIDLKVDGIMTDYPSRLQEVYNSQK